jgi:hypothetical protein
MFHATTGDFVIYINEKYDDNILPHLNATLGRSTDAMAKDGGRFIEFSEEMKLKLRKNVESEDLQNSLSSFIALEPTRRFHVMKTGGKGIAEREEVIDWRVVTKYILSCVCENPEGCGYSEFLRDFSNLNNNMMTLKYEIKLYELILKNINARRFAESV